MNKTETLRLLSLYAAAYPTAEMNEIQIELWVEMLQELPLETGIRNMREHIRTSKYAPTIAEIVHVERTGRIDPEIRQRNRDIAHQNWVREGGDPEAWSYQLMMPKRELIGK